MIRQRSFSCFSSNFFFFFNDTATSEIYTLSLHDALPIHRKTQSRSIFPSRLGHRRGSPPPRHSRRRARLRRQLHGHLLPRHFPLLPAPLRPLLRASSQLAARRLPRYRHRHLRRPPRRTTRLRLLQMRRKTRGVAPARSANKKVSA